MLPGASQRGPTALSRCLFLSSKSAARFAPPTSHQPRPQRWLHSTAPTTASNYRRFGEPRPSLQSQRARGSPNLPVSSQASPLAALAKALLASGSKGPGGGGGNNGRGGGRGGPSSFGPLKFLANMPPVLLLLVGGGGVYYVIHLESVPYTGRTRFMDLFPSAEVQMGVESYNEVLRQYRRKIYPADHPVAKEVREVATRIVRALEKGGLEVPGSGQGKQVTSSLPGGGGGGVGDQDGGKTKWEVFVIDDEQKNAFVLPGGKIFVFSGILGVTKNKDGLATVLGHEVAHQALRHSAEKASSFKVLVALCFGLELMGIDFGLSRSLLTLLMSLPNSRKLESEADRLGLRIMSAACFDPRESTGLWKRMEASEGTTSSVLSSVGAILSTHPVNAQRVKDLEKWIPEATAIRDAHSCPPSPILSGFRSSGMGGFAM